jgi:predicted dehydrogenase
MPESSPLNRRQFLAATGVASAAAGLVGSPPAFSQNFAAAKPVGANDKINIGIVGTGGRGTYLGKQYAQVAEEDNSLKIVAVCDVYRKRLNANKEAHNCDATLDYREIIGRKDIDAVVVATPDHWHAPIALAAMDAGKDVYLEKPMCHTMDEIKQLREAVRKTGRVIQVGSQTTSAHQWWKAREVIASGMLGKMIMSQGSYHRNSVEGEWNYKIDPGAGPDGSGDNYIDWKTWLGPAPKRDWDADRFFRFRKYWDYSGGIATDLFFHVMAPMNICWGEAQFPHRVTSSGGKYVFINDREVPDTFHFMAEYAKGHSVVLTSTMANSQHIPGLIRGHLASLIMVEHGRFEETTPYLIVRPEKRVIDAEYQAKWGADEVKIPVDVEADEDVWVRTHIRNFLSSIKSRQPPTLNVEIAARAQVAISMSVLAYQQGKVLYFDEDKWKATDKEPKA